MKTAMQELLEWVRQTLPMDLDFPQMIEAKIELLIKKEREQLSEEPFRADVRMGADGTYTLAGYIKPKDFAITFTTLVGTSELHIPFDDLHKVAVLLNEYLQSNGIKSNID